MREKDGRAEEGARKESFEVSEGGMTPTSLVTGTSLMTSFSTVTYCVICEFVKRFKQSS
jgi:hypothetical protein